RLSLDPGTAHPRLALSQDLQQVRWAESWQQPSGHSPKRFDSSRCLLTREGFQSGRHYWEVLLGGTRGAAWALGVAKESVGRKGRLKINPEAGIWALGRCGDLCQALTSPGGGVCIPLEVPPEAVGILLDCQAGQVLFYDALRGVLIFAYPPESFGGERMFP
ncbi:A33 protein, partial [Tricholaema leucomelas]|nr:A33 protein [Tricholaema leucomelas]